MNDYLCTDKIILKHYKVNKTYLWVTSVQPYPYQYNSSAPAVKGVENFAGSLSHPWLIPSLNSGIIELIGGKILMA